MLPYWFSYIHAQSQQTYLDNLSLKRKIEKVHLHQKAQFRLEYDILFNLQLNLIIEMSKPSENISPASANNNKLELLNDIVAFLSIISAYQFLSFTLHYNVFQGLFGLTFSHINDIALIYIVYAILIILLKILSLVIKLIKKEDTQLTNQINSAVNTSLYYVFLVITVSALTAIYGQPVDIPTLCHVVAWLFVAQLNLILCGLLRKIKIFQSISLFGLTIQVILVIGQLLRLLEIDFFEFL